VGSPYFVAGAFVLNKNSFWTKSMKAGRAISVKVAINTMKNFFSSSGLIMIAGENLAAIEKIEGGWILSCHNQVGKRTIKICPETLFFIWENLHYEPLGLLIKNDELLLPVTFYKRTNPLLIEHE
jgi:hypothetical protein